MKRIWKWLGRHGNWLSTLGLVVLWGTADGWDWLTRVGLFISGTQLGLAVMEEEKERREEDDRRGVLEAGD